MSKFEGIAKELLLQNEEVKENVIFISVKDIKDYHNPYSVEHDEKLLESIKEFGVQTPLILSQDYEILGGNRRLGACKELGIDKVPAIIKQCSNEYEKMLHVALSNEYRTLKPSELAKTYSIISDYLKSKGKKATKFVMAEKTGLSNSQQERLKKINLLDDHFKSMLDSNDIKMRDIDKLKLNSNIEVNDQMQSIIDQNNDEYKLNKKLSKLVNDVINYSDEFTEDQKKHIIEVLE